METVKVTVIAEDDSGIFFKESLEVAREELVAPGMATAGLKTVAEALLRAASATA